MVEMARTERRVVQVGTHRRSGHSYAAAARLIASGKLGKVTVGRAFDTTNMHPSGIGKAPPSDPPLDWDLWLGPAPWSPYTPARCHFNFRYFFDYSGGTYADFWCHIADIAYWAMGDLGEPKTIDARGETPKDGIADTPAWIDVDYDYGDVKLLWTTKAPDVPGAAGRGIGCQFEGDRGSMVVDYGSRVLFIDGKEMADVPEVPQSVPRSPGHQRNFLDCVRSREEPESNLDYVHNMTLPMLLGCISFRLGRKLEWDSARQRFIDDAAANRMLAPPYREPWHLPA